MKYKVFESTEKNVWKYIFESKDIIAEAVLYQYNSFEERTVICCSVQSGCPVGCLFCGTGKKFIKNLTSVQIVEQIQIVLKDKGLGANDNCKKFQIMFMSMGEPMLNWDNVEKAIIELNRLYPNADLLVSTVGIKNEDIFQRIIKLSVKIDKIGLQFSIHKSNDEERNELIPFKNKFTLLELRDHGMAWFLATKRPVFLNYCIDGENNTDQDIKNLKMMFSPIMFYFTFSVICDSGQDTMKLASFRNHDIIKDVMNNFLTDGYNVRMFDPAGQDDIGGGCGQLWYVQDWLKEKK